MRWILDYLRARLRLLALFALWIVIFAVVFSLYEGAWDHLRDGGRLFVVIQKKHGAESTLTKLQELFGSVEIRYKKKGVYVLEARK